MVIIVTWDLERSELVDFIDAEHENSDRPKASAIDFLRELEKYQGMLWRTKAFQRQ